MIGLIIGLSMLRRVTMDNTHRIVHVNGHYEAHNSYGEFVTSGDTYKECEDDLIEMLVENARMENIREKVSA